MDEKSYENGCLNGVYETLADLVGYENTYKIYHSFRGAQINFPTRFFSKEYVTQEVIKNYDGSAESINFIASKYHYSERTVRNLLKSVINKPE